MTQEYLKGALSAHSWPPDLVFVMIPCLFLTLQIVFTVKRDFYEELLIIFHLSVFLQAGGVTGRHYREEGGREDEDLLGVPWLNHGPVPHCQLPVTT